MYCHSGNSETAEVVESNESEQSRGMEYVIKSGSISSTQCSEADEHDPPPIVTVVSLFRIDRTIAS
jgi:hypothetical protein